MSNQPKHILLYDGDCDFCREWATWLTLRDATTRKFQICPWQVVTGPPMTPLLRVQAQRAVQLITIDGKQLSGGRAVLFALRETGWYPGLIRLLESPPLVWSVALGYRIVATHRDRFSWLRP